MSGEAQDNSPNRSERRNIATLQASSCRTFAWSQSFFHGALHIFTTCLASLASRSQITVNRLAAATVLDRKIPPAQPMLHGGLCRTLQQIAIIDASGLSQMMQATCGFGGSGYDTCTVGVPAMYKLAVSGQDQQLTWGNMIDWG